ncbi:MAG: c-type cytochrome [Gemmataceae bacterium]|nr:c-type cytochrome [Gemmataceae bacterium]
MRLVSARNAGLGAAGFLFAGTVVLSATAWLLSQEQSAALNAGLKTPAGLPAVRLPDGKAPSAAEIELGKQLYFDTRLSRDRTVSCASCHDPQKGWSNGERFATGIGGKVGDRSAPTIINAAYFPLQFWDGRAQELEGQALGPIQNPIEMDLTLDELVMRLQAIPGYKKQFDAIYKDGVSADNVARAIASFERTVLSGNAPYDRYKAGDAKALSEAARRGADVFFNKAHCTACHSGPNFSDGGFHNVGIGLHGKDFKAKNFDVGREKISGLEGDRGSFKTPTLREIARTAPYMHDGSLKTLEEVVDYYDRGGNKNPWLDEELFVLKLTARQKADLVTFLKEGLSSPDYPVVRPPSLPPDPK